MPEKKNVGERTKMKNKIDWKNVFIEIVASIISTAIICSLYAYRTHQLMDELRGQQEQMVELTSRATDLVNEVLQCINVEQQ